MLFMAITASTVVSFTLWPSSAREELLYYPSTTFRLYRHADDGLASQWLNLLIHSLSWFAFRLID